MARVPRKHAEVPKSFKGELERKALLKQLRGAHEARVIALLAPAGYGKTTLLSQLARASSSTVAWVSLLADDADTTRLIASTVEALERALPGAFARVLEMLAQPVSPEALTRALVQELAQLEGNATVVFDKAERLSALGGNWLNDLVQRLPEGHQIWIAGYASAPLPMARWIADGFAVMLSDRDLAFSELESTAVLRKHTASSAVTSESLQALEGWPAAVSLLARGAVTAFVQPRDLLNQTVERLPPALRDAVPALCACEVWEAALPARLGVDVPVGWLSALLETGLPLTRLADGRFAPHSLLLDALRERLEQDAPRFKEVYRRSAELKELDGQPISALRLFARGYWYEETVRVVERVVPDLLNRYEYTLVLDLVALVPEAVRTPSVWLYEGVALTETGQAAKGSALLREHMHGSGKEVRALCALSLEHYKAGDYLQQLRLLEEAKPFIRTDEDALRVGIRQFSALRQLGRTDGLLDRILELRQVAERHGDPYLLSHTLEILALEYREAGKNTLCEEAYQQALEVLDSVGAERRKLPYIANFANTLHVWGRTAEAMALAQLGLQSTDLGTPFWRMAFLGHVGNFFFTLGDFDGAESNIRACLELCTKNGYKGPSVFFWQALSQLYCLQGRVDASAECLERDEAMILTVPSVDWSRLQFSKALWLFVSQRHTEAESLFSALSEDKLLDDWIGLRSAACFAQLCFVTNTLGEMHAEAITKWGNKIGHFQAIAPYLRLVEPALRHLIAQGWLKLDIEALKASSVRVDDTKPELFVQAMGVSIIAVNGVQVRPRLKRCFELLVWLCIHGSGTKEQIVNALWDGSRNRSHADHFKVIVRNLRADLVAQGNLAFNPIEFDGKRYAVSRIFRVRTDFPTSSDAVAQTNPVAIGERAVFMEGVYTNWVADYRTGLETATSDESQPIRLESENEPPQSWLET